MYCKQCGNAIADDSRFCQHCGNVQDSNSIAQVQPETKENVQESTKTSEDKSKKVVRAIIKEVRTIALIVIIAFAVKGLAYLAIDIQRFPEISEEVQKQANNVSSGSNSGHFRLYEEEARLVKLGEYKYDDELRDYNELSNINAFRKRVFAKHASKTSKIAFWIALPAIALFWYIRRLVRWLSE